MTYAFVCATIYLGGASMKTMMVTQARKELYNIVDETITHSIPIQIVSKRGDAILISAADWNAIQETLYLSSIIGFEESLNNADDDEWLTEDEVEW